MVKKKKEKTTPFPVYCSPCKREIEKHWSGLCSYCFSRWLKQVEKYGDKQFTGAKPTNVGRTPKSKKTSRAGHRGNSPAVTEGEQA